MTEEKPCRHEYVRIYQRKLKGLDRRLVATKAYLPIGFKVGDFSHLSEGSFCFCSGCRARLYPRRTNQEKAAARVALAQGKADAAAAAAAALLAEEAAAADEAGLLDEPMEELPVTTAAIHVEELEIETVSLEDLEEARSSFGADDDEGSCQLSDPDEV